MDEIVSVYELCSVAPSLFDKNGFMRSGGKSKLGEYLIPTGARSDFASNVEMLKRSETKLVLDGAALLQRVIWPKGSTFSQIINSYELYIRKLCGEFEGRIHVVFDGYTTNSTKDHIHHKRYPGQSMDILMSMYSRNCGAKSLCSSQTF